MLSHECVFIEQQMFYLAMCTRRVLVIDAPFPVPLTEVLNPAHIQWNATFPETNLYRPDMVYNKSEPLGLREETLGYRIRQTNGFPQKKGLDDIWDSSLMNEHFRQNQWSDMAKNVTLAFVAHEAFEAMFNFDPAVIARADEFKASAGILGPYAGLHIRKGDANMGVTGQGEGELKGLQSRATDNSKLLSCLRDLKLANPNAFEESYLASDDVDTKHDMAELDPSIQFAQNIKPFHVDLLARRGNHNKFDVVDPAVLSGTIDTWAEMLILSKSTCLILSQSMFSFGALYIRDPGRCTIRLQRCHLRRHRDGHYAYYGESIYKRGWVVYENATT